jgi:hypothetical protein
MDNQQATSWLVGILDGEGSFDKNRLRISNTEIDLIHQCEDIISSFGISVSISSTQRGKRKREYDLAINGRIKCLCFLEELKTKLYCRQFHLESSETTCECSADFWWLIGILEAEGSFHISCHMSRNNTVNYNPEITVCSTNTKIIDKTVKTLYSLGLSWHISSYIPLKHSPYKVITIHGYKRVQRFFQIINEFQTKKYKLKSSLLKEFVNLRLLQNIKEPYTKRQHEIFYALRNVI